MATVYLAQDLKHRRPVAVKVLRPELAATLGGKRFLREVEIAARLSHPHLVGLIDSGEAAGFLYYVMPYVEGTSLRQKLQREGELPIAEAVRILRDVADALAHAHGHGVVHRDIKPENIMLVERHALVMDFGVAKALAEGQAPGGSGLTSAGVALGTPTYMAPEQAATDPHIDHRADLYAFGVVAYELLTGRPPFVASTSQAILGAHAMLEPEPVARHRPCIPGALAALVMKCLQKLPAERWQNAEELIPQLETVLTPSGGMTPTATQPHAAVRAPFPRRMAFTGGAVVVLGLAVGAVLLLTKGTKEGPPGGRVAVLPLMARSADSSDALLGEGIADAVGARLSRVPLLQVLSATAVRTMQAKATDPLEAARALKAEWAVAGALRRADGGLLAAVEVIRARTGVQRWSGSFKLTSQSLVSLDGEIAESVATAIAGRAGGAAPSVHQAAASRDPEVYRMFLLGNALLSRRTEDSRREAIKSYGLAVARDSMFALGWARIALARAYQLSWTPSPASTPGWIDGIPRDSVAVLARQALQRALRLDSLLGESWLAAGAVSSIIDRDFRAFRTQMERAIQLDSTNAEIHHVYGSILGPDRLNELDAAEPHLRKALALEPDRPTTWAHLALLERNRGNLASAEAIADTLLSLGRWAPGLMVRAYTRYLRGNGKGALEDQAECDRLTGTTDSVSGSIYRLALGDSAPARRLVAQLSRRSRTEWDQRSHAWLAMELGRRDEALASLEALPATARGTGEDLAWTFLNLPSFAPLRGDPRFQALLAKHKAAIKWDFSK